MSCPVRGTSVSPQPRALVTSKPLLKSFKKDAKFVPVDGYYTRILRAHTHTHNTHTHMLSDDKHDRMNLIHAHTHTRTKKSHTHAHTHTHTITNTHTHTHTHTHKHTHTYTHLVPLQICLAAFVIATEMCIGAVDKNTKRN